MADEYNPIEINNFPETTDLLSSDKIIVFEGSNNNPSLHLYNVADLSVIAIFSLDTEDIENKVNLIKESIRDAINYLQKTFISKSDAATIYATIASLNAEMAKLEKTTAFLNKMANKAEMAYLDYLYNKIRTDCARVKARLGDGAWRHGDERGKGYKVITAAVAGKKTE